MNTWSTINPSSTWPMSQENIRIVYLAFKQRADNKETKYAMRDYIFIRLYIETGERPGALLKSKITDFSLTNRLLTIPPNNEKTNKTKYYVLTHSLVFALKKYFSEYNEWINKRYGRIFFSNVKRGGGYIKENYFSFFIYKPLMERIGLYQPIKAGKTWFNKNNLYSIRAGVFTYLAKDCGYTPKEVQQRSQHSHLSTLERFYLKYDMMETQESIAVAQAQLTA